MNSLTKNGIKLCKECNQNKPLSEFPIKWKGASYGKCKHCTDVYEFNRRRRKGIPIRKEKKLTAKPVAHDVKAVNRMKAIKYHRSKHPHILVLCKECNASFEAPRNRVFCTVKCGQKYHRRVRKKKERARMRSALIERVNPIKVFEAYQWHCANCGTYTPRHLKGKQIDNSPELDHIVPLSRGGEHSYVNTQLLCRKCNNTKSNNIIIKLTG